MEIADIPGGLRLELETSKPSLRLETTRSRRMRLTAAGEPLVWAQLEKQYAGVWVIRAKDKQVSIARPIRADEARDGRSMEAWVRWFATELQSGTSPLSTGEWRMSSMRRAESSIRDRIKSGAPDVYFSNHDEGDPGPAYGALKAMDTPAFTSKIGALTGPPGSCRFAMQVLKTLGESSLGENMRATERCHLFCFGGSQPSILTSFWMVTTGSPQPPRKVSRRSSSHSGSAPICPSTTTSRPEPSSYNRTRRPSRRVRCPPAAERDSTQGSCGATRTLLRTLTVAKASPALEAVWLEEARAAAKGKDLPSFLERDEL